MKYKSVEKWAASREADTYDFVEDTQTNQKEDLLNDFHNLDSFEKFFIYKYGTEEKGRRPKRSCLAGLGEKESNSAKEFMEVAGKYRIGDPDSESRLLQNIYKFLWGDLTEQPFMRRQTKRSRMTEAGKDSIVIASDTMTSAMVRFTDAMKTVIPNNPLQKKCEARKELIDKISEIHKMCGSGQRWWTANFCIMVMACLDKNQKEEFAEMIDSCDYYPAMRKFLDLSHTVGNYCPVPAGFNAARSGFGKRDYWDLTLMKIYEWYEADKTDETADSKKEEILKTLLKGRNSVCRQNCREWLEWFKKEAVGKTNKDGMPYDGWHYFVDTLFMQDYMRDDKDFENGYTVKTFWSSHGWGEDKKFGLPEKKDEINEGLEEICSRITKRSRRIVNACRNRLKLHNRQNIN